MRYVPRLRNCDYLLIVHRFTHAFSPVPSDAVRMVPCDATATSPKLRWTYTANRIPFSCMIPRCGHSAISCGVSRPLRYVVPCFGSCSGPLSDTVSQIPNKYDVISLRPAGGKLDDRHWYVESTRWKTPAETAKAWKSDGRAYDIPNPALLRVHAMVATVLARSGSRDLIVNPYDFVPTGLDGRVDNTMGPIAFHEGRDVDDLYAFEQTQQLPLWSQAAKLPGRVLRTCAPCVKHWLVRNAPWSANGASGVEDTDPPPAYSSRRASKEILPAYGEVHRV